MASEERIESAINREVAGALTIRPQSSGITAFTIEPRSMSDVMEFAKLMAISGICIRPIFRGNPGACLAVTLQAMKWGADPFAVANKAFVVNDQLSYESQLVHAIVNSSARLAKRLDAVFEGEGQGRQCRVHGYIKGDDEAREYLSPKLGEIPTKNSPLWKADPDQQLFYYSTRAWARRWLPEVLLGIYTPEELAPPVELTAEPNPAEVKPQRKQSQLERFEERGGAAPPETPQEAATAQDPTAGADGSQDAPEAAPAPPSAAVEAPKPEPVAAPDTPRQNFAIEVPQNPRGDPNYKAWTLGLLIPKMRQMTVSNDLAWFLADNDEDIELAKRDPELQREIEAAAAAQWKAIGDAR